MSNTQSPWVPTSGSREDAFEAGWYDAHDQFCEHGGYCSEHAYRRRPTVPVESDQDAFAAQVRDAREAKAQAFGNHSFRPERGAE